MAIFTSGTIVGTISGAVGGQVFVSGGRSQVVRPRPAARSRTTPPLAASRAAMFNVRRAWSGLTEAEQLTWTTIATGILRTNRLGQSSPLSGFELFVKSNLELRLASSSFLDAADAQGASGAPRSVSSTFKVSTTFLVTAQPPEGFGTAIFFVYGWPYWVDHDTKSPPRLRFLATTGAASLSLDVKALWEALWGPMVDTQRYVIGVAAQVGGRRRSQIILDRGTVIP